MRTLYVLALAACAPAPSPVAPKPAADDAAHAFDFHLGTWRTHIRRRHDASWVEYDGVTTVRPVWNGRANLVELVADGAAGHLELLSLRLYNPADRTWALHVGNARDGSMSPPVIGRFTNGRGEFVGAETIDGKPILVRFVVSQVAPASAQFEQAFSADAGTTWEVNWIAVDTPVTAPR